MDREQFLAEIREMIEGSIVKHLGGSPRRGVTYVPGAGGGSLADQILGSDAFKRFKDQRARTSDDIVLKSALTPEPGGRIEAVVKYLAVSNLGRGTDLTPRLVFPTRKLRMRDLMNVVGLTAPSLVYTRMTGFSNNAAFVGEGVSKPESTIVSAPVTAQAKKVATFIPVSRESLDDVGSTRAFLDSVLESAVLDKEDDALLNGNEVGESIRGILQTAGIQTQAKGGDTSLDAIRKAVTKVQTAWTTNGFNPTGLVVHPQTAEALDLLKDGQLRYLLLPETAAPTDMPARRIWGLDVVVTPAIAAGTGLVGDFGMGEVYSWTPLTVRFSDSHSTFFVENKVAVLAEERMLIAIYAPAAFCTVTGL